MSASVSILCVEELRLEVRSARGGVAPYAPLVGLIAGEEPRPVLVGLKMCCGRLEADVVGLLNGDEVGPGLKALDRPREMFL